MDVDLLLCTGSLGANLAAGARKAGMPARRIRHHAKLEDLAADLMETVEDGDRVLIKASHSMRFETLVRALRERVEEVL